MSVEDTDFSPPATSVMFLLTIHPTALEAGDFLSTGVKFRHVPEAFPYYRLFFLCVASRAGNRKSPPVFVFTSAGGLWGFLRILFFRPGPVQASCGAARLYHNPRHLGYLRDFCVLGAAVYLIHRGCDDKPFDAVLCKDVVVAAAESFFRMQRSVSSSATALS